MVRLDQTLRPQSPDFMLQQLWRRQEVTEDWVLVAYVAAAEAVAQVAQVVTAHGTLTEL